MDGQLRRDHIMRPKFLIFIFIVFSNILFGADKGGKTMTYPAKQITISINRPVADVYGFVSDPGNLPKWAEGLSRSTLTKSGDDWIADSPMGKVKVRFVKKNDFGVLDHDVTLPSGEVNHNPLRVIKNGDGSEVIFTLYHLPARSQQEFDKDADLVQSDLKKLKAVLEK
jgi:hypothetical protein